MKALPAIILALMPALTAVSRDTRSFGQSARTVIHADDSYTESVQDITAREQREVTYSPKPQSVVIAKKVYLLDDKGQPLQGNVYDGKGQLKARVQFLYDDFGRMSEERMYNLQGQVFQTITFGYDRNQKPLPPKSQTFNVASPNMSPATLDFTQQGQAPGALDRSQGDPSAQPRMGNVPYLPEGGRSQVRPDTNGTSSTQQPTEQKKGSLLKRLFGGKKKDEQK
jgi:hypothetical protein